MTKKQYNAYKNMSIEQLNELLRGFFDAEDSFPERSASKNKLSAETLETIITILEQKTAARNASAAAVGSENTAEPAGLKDSSETASYSMQTSFEELLAGFSEAPFAIDMEYSEETELLQHFLPKRKHHSLLRSVAAAAVIFIFTSIFSAVGISAATGQGLISWIEETFHITFGDGYVDSTALAEAISSYGTDCRTVPTRSPDGFSMTTMDVIPEPGRITYFAEYEAEDCAYSITAVQYTMGTIPADTVITSGDVCSYEGIDYYFSVADDDATEHILDSDGNERVFNRYCWTEGTIVFTLKGLLTQQQMQELLGIC